MRRLIFVAAMGLLVCACTGAKQHGAAVDRIGAGDTQSATTERPSAADESPDRDRLSSASLNPAMEMAVDNSAAIDAGSASRAKRVDYKPGIVLNYPKLQVEVASQVILRRGDLELFAWSKAPVPKEHESILMVDAQPSDVYDALGLMGLTPGTPPRYDVEAQRPIPATGDRVEVLVRYKKKRRSVEHSICDWAIDKSREAPMTPRDWVFCGSYRTEQGAFVADSEGTLVTVVDFPSSLLSLAETHSESNADLWLVANTDAIPEEGTPVTLILRAAKK